MDIFQKRMTLIAFLFRRLCPAKSVVRYMCKSSTSFYPSKRNMANWSQLFKFERQHLYDIYWSTGRQLSCKKSLLVKWESLRLFLNTRSAVHKCSLPHRDNSMEPIHMQLSHFAFSKFRLNFGHFPKKDTPHSLFISEATVC